MKLLASFSIIVTRKKLKACRYLKRRRENPVHQRMQQVHARLEKLEFSFSCKDIFPQVSCKQREIQQIY